MRLVIAAFGQKRLEEMLGLKINDGRKSERVSGTMEGRMRKL